jgi:hypothetical protein
VEGTAINQIAQLDFAVKEMNHNEAPNSKKIILSPDYWIDLIALPELWGDVHFPSDG